MTKNREKYPKIRENFSFCDFRRKKQKNASTSAKNIFKKRNFMENGGKTAR
ncbi:MAG: hypothetical protein K6D98_04955 [Clostridiales bacterium]|nr:hypothetical protein [Clostridiales bacterium]